MEGIRLQSLIEDRPEFDAAMYPIGEHLILTLVYDMPQAMQSLPPEMLTVPKPGSIISFSNFPL